MAGTEQAYHLTKEDVKKAESKASNAHGGNVPAGSEAALNQSIVDKADQNKADLIAERQANLPRPEEPPVASDFKSADPSTVNVGSGGVSTGVSYGNDALRDPAAADSAVRTDPSVTKTNVAGQGVGREAFEGGLPNDAVARGSKNKEGLADTTK